MLKKVKLKARRVTPAHEDEVDDSHKWLSQEDCMTFRNCGVCWIRSYDAAAKESCKGPPPPLVALGRESAIRALKLGAKPVIDVTGGRR